MRTLRTDLNTGYNSNPTVEFTWALILALVRNVATESVSLRGGGWQTAVGADLFGKTLGVVGLGNIGSRVAEIGRAFGMNVIAWSQNRTNGLASSEGMRTVRNGSGTESARCARFCLRDTKGGYNGRKK